MAQAEPQRSDGIEAVAIVTPNHMHYPIAKAFLDAGIHVICDKPLTSTLQDARALVEVAEASGRLFVLTHNYTGYPMVRQARSLVAAGDLGDVRLIQVEYAQDWLTEKLEDSGQKQASWRVDPKQAGAGGSLGDIGTHAYNLASFVTGQKAAEVAADLTCFVQGRALDDNAHVMLRYDGGAKGLLWSSQVAPGNENALKLRVYGTKGGLEWEQEQPNHLWFTPFGKSKRLITRGGAGAGKAAGRVTRIPPGHPEGYLAILSILYYLLPPGHPEGYLEGFANIYGEAAAAIRAARTGTPVAAEVLYPTVQDGLEGLRFIEACVRSAERNGAWTTLG